jgi:hypothetical protein
VQKEANMSSHVTKRLREGNLLAEVQVALIPDDNSWAPYLSLEDARKLERVKSALKRGDAVAAARDAKVFEVMALAGE